MAKCDFCEIRSWGKVYCLKKDDYVNDSTYYDYCNSYKYDDCPIYSSSSSSSGCYLTSACVHFKGLPDDCMELSLLRKFRDEYLSKTEGGKEEILEYYQTAPQIVKAINESGKSDEVYEKLYSGVICKCVKLILAGKNEETHMEYKKMVENLKAQYF